MALNRRLFVVSLAAISIVGIEQHEAIVNGQDSKNWLDELTSTIKKTIAFVDDARASLKKQGVEIDRQKLKPSVSKLNMAVNTLLSNLTNLKRTVDRKDGKDSEIADSASNLSPQANRMIEAMGAMFKQMSLLDTSLEKHKNTIFQLVTTRAGIVEQIVRTITIRPTGGKIDRKALRTELNGAIQISNSLLQSIQGLIKELG